MREPIDWPTRDLLSHRSNSTPERTALIDAGTNREWSYRALDAIVDGVTARLQAFQRREDSSDRVALLASTRVGFVAAVHAGLRNGDTLVPLNTQLTDEALAEQVDRTEPDVLVCERDTESTAVAIADCSVVSLDRPTDESVSPLQPADEQESAAVEPATWSREETAVIMFTSGTTGAAKGVRLTLGNMIASATASAFRLGVTPGDRWLCCLPTYHMGGLAPVFRTALYGTTLVLQQSFDTESTPSALDSYSATGVSLVPTQLRRLLDAGWAPPESIRTVLLGGAPASEELVVEARENDIPVAPTYGLTEVASQVATATPAEADRHPDSVGQPLLFTEVSVRDEDGNRVESGQTGELVVNGPTVTPGYLDETRTGAAFDEHGLHTGDIGYCDEDGRLWVLGRADDTILTGGENVHPTEVADALSGHDGVAEVAVVGISDEEWGERIGALVVPAGDSLTVADIESHARDSLASYKVPKTIGLASSLPRTASGTVDREAVRQLLRE